MKRIHFFRIAILLIGINILIILFAPSLLTVSLSSTSNIPIGNFIIWAGIIALPCAVLSGIRNIYRPENSKDGVYNFLLKALILLSGLWGIVGYFLSGNWAFTFKNDPQSSAIYWNYVYFIVTAPIGVALIYGIHTLVVKMLETGKN